MKKSITITRAEFEQLKALKNTNVTIGGVDYKVHSFVPAVFNGNVFTYVTKKKAPTEIIPLYIKN